MRSKLASKLCRSCSTLKQASLHTITKLRSGFTSSHSSSSLISLESPVNNHFPILPHLLPFASHKSFIGDRSDSKAFAFAEINQRTVLANFRYTNPRCVV